MEITLGRHCARPDCHQLDFLPFKCDACREVFCLEHRTYSAHDCDAGKAKLTQREAAVPHCPLCSIPIPLRPGESADAKVDEHISRGCTIKRTKCIAPRCNVSDLAMILQCQKCSQNVCLKHRWPDAHRCSAPPAPPATARPKTINVR